MSKTTKDSAKTEDVVGPATVRLASVGDEEYYELPDTELTGNVGTAGQRPLPSAPNTAGSGQSRSHDTRGVETAGSDPNAVLHRNHARSSGQGQLEAFILRNLSVFKGEYDGTAITDWVQKVDVLLKLTGAEDDETSILQLLPLRVDTQVYNFIEGLKDRWEPSQYTWTKVKQALLRQYGGVVDPSKQVNRLQNARMGRDTPVRKFAQEVERLARLSYPELAGDKGTSEQREVQRGILNRILLEQFVAGLPPMLSRTLVERQVEDFDTAVDLAAHMDEVNARYFKRSTINAFFSEEDGDRRRPKDKNVFHSEEDSDRRHPNNKESKPQGFRPRNQTNPPRRPGELPGGRRQVRYADSDSTRPRGTGARAERLNGKRCYQCGEEGHLQFSCPKCFLCGQDHPIQMCKNVVCARCKQTGHAATRCSKNLAGPHQPPPTS